jgi:hypothetical protein
VTYSTFVWAGAVSRRTSDVKRTLSVRDSRVCLAGTIVTTDVSEPRSDLSSRCSRKVIASTIFIYHTHNSNANGNASMPHTHTVKIAYEYIALQSCTLHIALQSCTLHHPPIKSRIGPNHPHGLRVSHATPRNRSRLAAISSRCQLIWRGPISSHLAAISSRCHLIAYRCHRAVTPPPPPLSLGPPSQRITPYPLSLKRPTPDRCSRDPPSLWPRCAPRCAPSCTIVLRHGLTLSLSLSLTPTTDPNPNPHQCDRAQARCACAGGACSGLRA